jgi:hypothetical protein
MNCCARSSCWTQLKPGDTFRADFGDMQLILVALKIEFFDFKGKPNQKVTCGVITFAHKDPYVADPGFTRYSLYPLSACRLELL